MIEGHTLYLGDEVIDDKEPMTDDAFVINVANRLFRLAPIVSGMDGYHIERLIRIARKIDQYFDPDANREEGRDEAGASSLGDDQ